MTTLKGPGKEMGKKADIYVVGSERERNGK